MKLIMLAGFAAALTASPTVYNVPGDVTYVGIERNGIEVFLGIPYGQDTSGENRFKPPRPYVPAPGSTVDASNPGLPCPQLMGQWNPPLTLNNITETSEDCLNLNIARSKGNRTYNDDDLKNGTAVMLWIHGGSFWVGSNLEPTHQPDAFVQEAYDNGFPVIHVAINYRLGVFGFAKSETLRKERSENAGLRDQRLAIEWVRDNIRHFGGDPNRITIFGQSSGGLAVGLQLLAYGGTKPLPYQQGICQSQALEPGITGNFTDGAMAKVIAELDCNREDNSTYFSDAIACLRSKDTQTVLDASLSTYSGDIAHNIGDIWLPSVDGDFLPDAPSKLIAERRFGDAAYMLGWAQDDVNFFTDVNIKNDEDTQNFINTYVPLPDPPEVGKVTKDPTIFGLYPSTEFTPPPGTNLTSEFYRSARIFRDILMVCEPLYLAEAISLKGNTVYLYNWNQTILDPVLESVYNISGLGVVHTSEFAYIYANLSHYNVSGYPFNPTQADYDLMHRASRTWSFFGSTGRMENGLGTETNGLQDWKWAFWRYGPESWNPPRAGYTYVYTIGGPREGFYALDGPDSVEEVRVQNLRERCAWLNDPVHLELLGV